MRPMPSSSALSVKVVAKPTRSSYLRELLYLIIRFSDSANSFAFSPFIDCRMVGLGAGEGVTRGYLAASSWKTLSLSISAGVKDKSSLGNLGAGLAVR